MAELLDMFLHSKQKTSPVKETLGGNSIGFLDRLTDLLKMGNGLKMSDFRLGMSLAMI